MTKKLLQRWHQKHTTYSVQSILIRTPSLLLIALVLITLSLTLFSGCTKTDGRKPFLSDTPSPPAPATVAKPNYTALRTSLRNYMANRGGSYSFYLFDLSSGGALDINSTKPIAGASTTKIPIVLYLYRQVADGKVNLNDTMTYNKNLDYQTGAGAMQFFAVDGLKYRYRTLANLTITLSDNVGKRMLVRKLSQANIAAYMTSLGGKTVYPNGQNITTARDMVTYLRATLAFQKKYPDLGKMFINDLSNTIWDNDGLPAKLPGNPVVAHKVGTITGIADDAGIIYLRGRPYILSILTEGVGQSIDDGFKAIAEISRMVYDFQAKLPKAGQ